MCLFKWPPHSPASPSPPWRLTVQVTDGDFHSEQISAYESGESKQSRRYLEIQLLALKERKSLCKTRGNSRVAPLFPTTNAPHRFVNLNTDQSVLRKHVCRG